jgi:hypothetical protein
MDGERRAFPLILVYMAFPVNSTISSKYANGYYVYST